MVAKMAADEGWRANADTHKMTPEDVEKLGLQKSKKPPGSHPGTTLHQRGRLGISKSGVIPLAIAGCLVAAGVGGMALYVLSKPEKSATDVAKTTVGAADAR